MTIQAIKEEVTVSPSFNILSANFSEIQKNFFAATNGDHILFKTRYLMIRIIYRVFLY